ncbi:MAG: hypothetical protein H6944_00905 [Zoogloeaceae bacterium]|uniref:hypothetical protein n=1 Tax=Denitromonas sp. TaxID=2734609 RepID=UPI001E00D9B8|nr:hypothetical protein [Rhodocyclaceae bacterium]MCP5220236.1 hypothetical protein [Zoogloeaceae bacterium]
MNESDSVMLVEAQSGRLLSGKEILNMGQKNAGLISIVGGEVDVDGSIFFTRSNTLLRQAGISPQVYIGSVSDARMHGSFVHNNVPGFVWKCQRS